MSSPTNSPKDLAPTLLGVSWSLSILATIFLGMRCHCRTNYQLSLWWDDIWVTISLLFSWAMSVTWTVYVHVGGTRYTPPLSPEESVNVNRISWISQLWCILSLATGKLAIAALILRLQAPSKWRTYVIWIMCVIAVIWNMIQMIFSCVQCRPIGKLWNPAIKGTCWSPRIIEKNAVASNAYSAFVDLVLVAIPVHMIWNLQMPLQRKLTVCTLLSTGIFAFAATVAKLIIYLADLSWSSDLIRTKALLFILNGCEASVVIIAGCIPAIMPLIELIFSGRDPYRFDHTRKGSENRLHFRKGIRNHASGWGTQLSHPYRSTAKNSTENSSSRIIHSDEAWDKSNTFNTGVCAHNENVEMVYGIQVTRQIDAESSSSALAI